MPFFTGGIWGARAAAQFDKTTDTAFATITGFSFNVEAGRTYLLRGWFPATFTAVGSGKFQLTGTATMTAIVAQWACLNNGTGAFTNSAKQTALTTAFNATAGATDAVVYLDATITVNAAGTLTVQFAQLVSNGTSSVLRGSRLTVLLAE
jgi:hypothetical protein